MLAHLSAFSLTPLRDDRLDEGALAALVARSAAAGVDSVGVLGSTGAGPYLSRIERASAARVAVEHAQGVPVIVGVGALRTREVLDAAADAQRAGAAAVMLQPVSYQRLTEGEVLALYTTVTAALDVPLLVYDNPRTTGFAFTDELYARVAALDGVYAVKLPGVPTDPDDPADPAPAREQLDRLRAALPDGVQVGVSGDATAAAGLLAGCDSWFSVVAGVLPGPALALVRAAAQDDADRVGELHHRLTPLWDQFARHGSIRVVAALATHLGLAAEDCLPAPLRPLDATGRADVVRALARLERA